MNRITINCYICAALLILISACDHGLDPERDRQKPGFDGSVALVEGWEESSDIRELYIVVFKSVPQDSADAVNQFFQGNIGFTGLEPPFREFYEYSIDMNPGTYELVALVGIKGTQFLNLANWVLSGIYTETNNPFEPSSITIPEGDRLPNVDIQGSVINTLPVPF